MKIPDSLPKVWIINLLLLAAVLFVYAGLNWFDSKNPEEPNAPPQAKQSFSERISNFFSSNDAKSTDHNETVQYGYAQDGTKLQLDTQDYAGTQGLTPDLAENQGRLNQVVQEISQANHNIGQLVLQQHKNPQDEDIRVAIEEAENKLYDLQDERDSLMARIRAEQSSQNGL